METLFVISKRTTNQDGSELVDKNGTPYCVLEFATPDTVYTRNSKGQMVAIARPITSVGGYAAWKVSNLQSNKGRADFGWDLQVGQEVQGTIAKRKVEPYFIPDGANSKKQGPVENPAKPGEYGRMVESASVVSFANSESPEELELDIQEQFRRKGHKLLGVGNTLQVDILNQQGLADSTAGTAKIDQQAAAAK